MNKRLIWTLGGVIVGVCMSFSLNYAICGLKRFKQQDKDKPRLTLRQLDERITKNAEDIKQLKKGK